jgi:hypothetical protein
MTASLHTRRIAVALAAALGAVLAVVGLATAARTTMTSTRISPKLCETTGGGKFVAIPGFPGEMIDRRLLADIRWIEHRYPIFITDGYSTDPVHAQNGEHPIGLALDIVPDKSAGGRWSDVTRLALWAEPKQNEPRTPFRWVGYEGDEGHGIGDHLHLSWSHSETKPGKPAKLIDTIRCPDPIGTTQPPTPDPPTPDPPTTGGSPGTGPSGHSGAHSHRHRHSENPPSSGGISHGKLALAPPVAETGGVGLGD